MALVRNSQVAMLCGHPRGRRDHLGDQRLAGAIARSRAASRGSARAVGRSPGDRDDAQGERRSLFRELPGRRRRGGARAWRRADLGRPERARRGAAERNRRELDHRGVDVIAVAVENRGGDLHGAEKGAGQGIKVVTWDADADPDARDFFVNQATPQGIGKTLIDEAAKLLNGRRICHRHRRAQCREPERMDST